MAESMKNMAGKASEKLSSGKGKEAMEKLSSKADKVTGGKASKGQEKLQQMAEKQKKSS